MFSRTGVEHVQVEGWARVEKTTRASPLFVFFRYFSYCCFVRAQAGRGAVEPHIEGLSFPGGPPSRWISVGLFWAFVSAFPTRLWVENFLCFGFDVKPIRPFQRRHFRIWALDAPSSRQVSFIRLGIQPDSLKSDLEKNNNTDIKSSFQTCIFSTVTANTR